ncbi:MAG: hypothetical protein K2K41_00755, partial [Ruminiclostridium sp.]|nr:hypothetical protein [Ruminiclostridium sp.]
MQKAKAISAIILSCSLLLLSSGCSGESNNIDFGEHTELTQGEDISEITQGTDSPEEIIYGDLVIGGNAILAQDTLDDLTSSLIIRDISHLPDSTEKGGYYGGRFIVAELKDNKSGVTVENILPRTSYTYGNLYSGFEEDWFMVIDAECATNSVKLFCIENNGKKEYILKVEYIRYVNGEYISAFACCDMSRYSGENAYLKWYTGGSPDNDFYLTHDFAYKSSNVFSDSRAEREYEFDTENLKVTERAMDPADIVFGEPEIGKNSILSQGTIGEGSAVLEMHNIIGMPEKDDVLLGKTYVGKKLYLKLIVNDNVIAYGGLPNGLVSESSVTIPEKCTGEGSTRIFPIEQNEKTYYVVMQYCMYDKESDSIGADFACFDPEVYEQYRDCIIYTY